MRAERPEPTATVPPTPAWWQRGVVYQIYPRSFADADGDGMGDLRGITSKVEYLAWLGIDAVWMSPMYPTPDADHGYDISDYVDVDPRLGTLADLDELVAALHERGIRLILDLVPNHTSDRHPWFVESRSGPENPRFDWYVWRDGRPDGTPPNNWESYFGGPAWHYLEPPGRWYLHSFDRGQPDLNWDNPSVRAAIADVMRFWLDRDIDGFRVDVLWLLSKDPQLRDNPPNPDWREGDPPWKRLLRRRSEDGPKAHDYVRYLRSVQDEYEDRVMVGEVVLPPARAVAFHGEHLDEAHLPHNFALPELPEWSAEAIGAVVDDYESLLPPGAWPNWLLGDHDLPRIASRVGPERVRLAHLLLLTLRGTPTWYYGDELGLPNAVFSPGAVATTDPQTSTGPERDRLVVRTPMQWEPGPAAGFTGGEPWLPISSPDPELTVERQRRDPASTLHYVRGLLALRSRTPALSVGTYHRLDAASGVLSYERAHPEGAVQVHLNFGEGEAAVEVPDGGRVVASTGDGSWRLERSALTLAPSGGAVVTPGG